MADLVDRYLEPEAGPVRFIGEQMILSDGRPAGTTWKQDPWIREELLRPIFARRDGRPRYSVVYDELPRGHAKSSYGGAIGLAEAVLFPSTDVTVAAGDEDQANVIGDHVRGFLNRNDLLAGSVRVTKNQFEVPERGSRIRIISSDADTAFGLGGTHRRARFLLDEVTVWKKPDLYEALIGSTGKVTDVQTVVFSNAGFEPDDETWQWKLRESARLRDYGHLFTSDGPIASWVTDEWIEQMRDLLPLLAFERQIENKWVAGEGDFITPEQWGRCVDDQWAPQAYAERGRAYAGGLDLGLKKDKTALAVTHRDAEGRVRLDALQTWQGSKRKPVDIEEVEDAVIDAARRFAPLRVRAETWQMAGSIQRLKKAGVDIEEVTPGQASIRKQSARLYNLIATARLQVFPDEELTREMLGLRVVQSASGWKADHGPGGHNDRATAIALAAEEVLDGRGGGGATAVSTRPRLGEPTIERGGLVRQGKRYLDKTPDGRLVPPRGWDYVAGSPRGGARRR